MKKNLVLTGMMGVGKSTVAKRLSKKLNLKFVDIDKIIEEKEKLRIKDIFKNKGENYFRKIEKTITLDILKKRNLVIALGGGAFINKSIRKEVNNNSISFWLDLNVKFIIPRIKVAIANLIRLAAIWSIPRDTLVLQIAENAKSTAVMIA